MTVIHNTIKCPHCNGCFAVKYFGSPKPETKGVVHNGCGQFVPIAEVLSQIKASAK